MQLRNPFSEGVAPDSHSLSHVSPSIFSRGPAGVTGLGGTPISGLTREERAALRQQERRRRQLREAKACCRRFLAFLFSHIGLSVLVVAYTILGAIVFRRLELDEEISVKQMAMRYRGDWASQLTSIYVEEWARQMAGSHDDPYLDGLTEQGQSLSGNNGHRAFLAPTDDGGCEMLNLTASLVIASLAEGSPRSSTDSLERVAVTLKLFSPTDLKGNVEPKLSKPRLGKIGQENATWIEKSQITEHNFTNYTQKTKLSNDSFLSEAATQEPPPLTLKELMENNPFLAGLNRRVRDRIIRQLKNITKEIIHLILDRGWNGEDSEADLKWSMEGAVLYAVTVITTIGKNRIISILLKQNHRFSIP